MRGWIDRLPTWARDLLIGAISAEAAWGVAELVPQLRELGGVWAALAPVVVVALGAVTRWTQAYGRSSREPDPDPLDWLD